MKKLKILYLSYDGLTDPLGQSQILPYLTGLSNLGVDITIVSAEKKGPFQEKNRAIAKICLENMINWKPVVYSKNPPILSTLFDLVKLYLLVVKMNKRQAFDIVHCRSYITALIGLRMKRKFGIKFIFDMRGFYADERVDGKIWNVLKQPYKAIYEFFKRKEKDYLKKADATISLTYRAKEIIEEWKLKGEEKISIDVIPCCVDQSLFNERNISVELRSELRKNLDLSDKFVITYLGSIGTWYMLKEMLEFFKYFQELKSNAVLLFVTGESKESILSKAREIGLAEELIRVTKADYRAMPTYLSLSDAAIFFIKPCFSKLASSPVKQGELMSMGIPIICNSNVGDTDKIILEYECGNLVDEFSKNGYNSSIKYLMNLESFNKEKAKEGAREYFSLKKGVDSYYNIYKRIVNK